MITPPGEKGATTKTGNPGREGNHGRAHTNKAIKTWRNIYAVAYTYMRRIKT